MISHRLWTSIQSGKVRAESPFGSPGAGSRNTCNPGALSSNVSNLTPWLSGLFFSRLQYKAADSFCRCRYLISSHTHAESLIASIRLSRNCFAVSCASIHVSLIVHLQNPACFLQQTDTAEQRAKRHAANHIKQGRGKALTPETKPPLALDPSTGPYLFSSHLRLAFVVLLPSR